MNKLNFQSEAEYNTWYDANYTKFRDYSIYSKGAAIWNAALASVQQSSPKAALTDEQIKEIANEWAMATHGYVNDPFGYCIDFARAIEAAAAPNAALVESLREALRQAEGWYDECRGGDASDFGWHKEAVAALAAAGVEEFK